MKTLTDEKLTIVGAAGMIGSNMAQTAIMMGLTSNICLYDPYAPGLEGVAEELFHCGFEGVNITFTSDIKDALTGAKYIVNSGGAARKAGMTREDLLKGNAAIAEEFGKNVKAYCPDVKHIVVIFNPADITGLITLLYSGLKPSQVTTLAALDSTRLRSELAKHFGVSMDVVENCRTYGGHGEQMAVYASTAKLDGKPLAGMIKFGIDWSWMDLNYAQYKVEAYDYDTDELYSEKAHQLEYGMQIGPSVTINPVHHLKVSAYFRVTPSYSMMYLNDEFYHHYATFCNTGFAVAWKVLSVGCEWRWGKASYDGLGLNLDDLEGDYSDGDFSGDIPSADDVLTDLQDLKLKTKSFRVYFSFRF